MIAPEPAQPALGSSAEQPEAPPSVKAPVNKGAGGAESHKSASHGRELPAARQRGRAVVKAERRWCVEPTRSGGRCTAPPLANEDRCLHHSKSAQAIALRDAARSRAGLATALRRLPPEIAVSYTTRDGVRALLEGTTRAVLAGQLSPSQANSVAGLAGVALRLAELEVSSALLALEQKLNELDRGGN